MAAVGHGLLIALGILEPTANLEPALALYFCSRWHALLTPEQRGEDQENQEDQGHGATPKIWAPGPGRPETRAGSRWPRARTHIIGSLRRSALLEREPISSCALKPPTDSKC